MCFQLYDSTGTNKKIQYSMRIASLPFNEELRLQDLYAYDILDSEQEKDFDDLLEVAAHIYGCPIAAISFIDQERQWLKSKKGLVSNMHEAPRDVAFCAHTILKNEVLIIEDTIKDERFADNPLVVNDPAIRFYAGAPIVSAKGFRLGSICIIDSKPRELSADDAKMLTILSEQVSKLLELRLRNKLLRQQAEEQLRLEKMLLQKTLQEHEKEKQSISAELHENIAQALAATKFYLEMAEEGHGAANTDLIRRSRQAITDLMIQVRELSQAIAPSLLSHVELRDLLKELLSRFHNQHGMAVHLLYEGDSTVDAVIALTVYRIVETQLLQAGRQSGNPCVTVNVNACASLYLSINNNGNSSDGQAYERGSGFAKILAAAEAVNGKVTVALCVKGGCTLSVTIPEQKKQNNKQCYAESV